MQPNRGTQRAAKSALLIRHSGQPFSRAHCCTCGRALNCRQASPFHAQPCIRTAAPAGVRSLRPCCTRPRSMGTLPPCPLEHLQMTPLGRIHTIVHLSQGQPFSCAHCRTWRWPESAASAHVISFHGQPCSPLQQLQKPSVSRKVAGQGIPRTALLSHPLQQAQVAAFGTLGSKVCVQLHRAVAHVRLLTSARSNAASVL